MNRVNRWISLGLVLTLGFLLGIMGFSLWDKMPSTLERVAWSPEVQWIGPQEPSYRFYVRRTFYIPDAVQAGWLRLSADNDFILYVNGQRVAQEVNVIKNSLGLATLLSERFQRFNDSRPYRFFGNHEWLHVSNPKDWMLTTYIDLTSYLQPGKNVIAIEFQKSRKNPRVVVEGAVYPVQEAAPIDLSTGATPWLISTVAQTRQQTFWFDPDFPDPSWSEAKVIGPVREATYSRLSQHIFDRPLQGNWITGTESPQGEIWLRGNWQVPDTRKRAFIRLAGDGEYGLLVNGLLVKSFSVNDRNQLHMYEVTNFLKTGVNTLAVRLARPLDPEISAIQSGSPSKNRVWLERFGQTAECNSLDLKTSELADTLSTICDSTPKTPKNNGALGFFLDGWVETARNSMTAPITTDSTWTALNQPISGWVEGLGQGQPATILSPPDPQEFQRRFEGNAYLLNYPNYLLHSSLWVLGGIGCAAACAWGLGYFWLGHRQDWWDSFAAGAAMLLPGTLFLIGIGLLKHRYAESERGFLFAQPQSTALVSLGFVGIVLLTMLWSQIGHSHKDQPDSSVKILPHWGLWFLLGLIAFVSLGLSTGGTGFSWSSIGYLLLLGFSEIFALSVFWKPLSWVYRDSFKAVLQSWHAWGQWFLLILIVGIGFGLRAYDLNFVGFDNDEWTSYDAIQGILRTGAPQATSEIWYTRSPFYHYLVALWLWLLGDSSFNGRFLSVLWGTATLVLVFFFTRKLTGKVWIALLITAILAIDPAEIRYSRLLRFYQVYQFVSLLTFWSFYRAFIDQSGRVYQYIFFIALTLTVLSQEVSITALPCFLVGFLFFYRPFRLSGDWPLLVSCLVSLGIIIYNLAFFVIRCITPVVALSNSLDSAMKPHLFNVTATVTAFFVGPSRLYTLYSIAFFLGFAYFLIRREGKLIFLFSSVFLNLIVMTILTVQISNRYAYTVYAPYIMMSVYSAICLTQALGRRLESVLKGVLPLRAIALSSAVLLIISNIEPERVLACYKDAITRRNAEVYEYIRDHRQPGDVVVSVTPAHSPIVGGLDYYLTGNTIAFDVPYWHEGRVIDRWGGGVITSNLDQLSRILEKSNRVWIHLDENRDVKFAPEVLQYLQSFTKPAFETFGTRLRLWQKDDGVLPRIPNQGKDLGVY